MVFVYSALVSLVTWLILVPLHWRSRDLRERLGFIDPLPPADRRIVIHAVSAGEAAAAKPLAAELMARGWSVVMTVGTAAGRAVAERISGVERVLALPWDRRAAIQRFLRAMNSDVVAVVETEIWPNLFLLAPKIVIVNARLYPGDRYHLARRFFVRVLSRALVLATTEREAGRFRRIGATHVEVMGNLKLDAGRRPADRPAGSRRSETILAVSTHPGEEELIAAALPPGARLIIAPRDVRRAAKLRRTFPNVIDTYGQLDALYAEADVAIIGGSFVPKGGHNPVEAAQHGCAVVIGPHIENVRDLVDALGDRIVVTNDLAKTLAEMKPQRRPFVMEGIAKRYADRIESLV
jgi:3-deoxy-D-manno-octulosonic-acid transferase